MKSFRMCLLAAAGIALTINAVSAIDLRPGPTVIRSMDGGLVLNSDRPAAPILTETVLGKSQTEASASR
jgi:hypothetical protein